MDQDNNGINDSTERKIEIGFSIVSIIVAIVGLFTSYLTGTQSVALICISFALYQGTSLAKIIKNVV